MQAASARSSPIRREGRSFSGKTTRESRADRLRFALVAIDAGLPGGPRRGEPFVGLDAHLEISVSLSRRFARSTRARWSRERTVTSGHPRMLSSPATTGAEIVAQGELEREAPEPVGSDVDRRGLRAAVVSAEHAALEGRA